MATFNVTVNFNVDIPYPDNIDPYDDSVEAFEKLGMYAYRYLSENFDFDNFNINIEIN